MVAALLICGVAAGQTTSGRIEGVVRDGSGGVLRGAAVRASSASMQGVRRASTDENGRFRFLALPPGDYVVRTTLPGFRPAEKAVTVSLGATATAELALEPAVAEAVSVEGEGPPIDATSTTGGTNYGARVISHLPTGRNYSDIVRANPGVSTDRGDTQGRSLALTIYGATSTENQWIVDGVDTTNVLKGFQGKAFSTEFVQEVEVKTGGYQAEYGGALGGIVNVVTKSGGNQFHGEASVYYDSTSTAAAQVFEPGDAVVNTMRIADGQQLDGGADLGGYVVKDRLWFFGAFDRVAFRGDVSRVTPTPNVSSDERFPLQTTGNLYSGKLTWNASPSTTVVAAVFADPATNSGASGADPRQGVGDSYVTPITSPVPATWSSSRALGGTDYGLSVSQLLGSRGVVTLLGGLHRDGNQLTASNLPRFEDRTCPPTNPDEPCPPDVPNFVSGGYGAILGPQDHFRSQRWQGRGDLMLYEKGHEIQGGVLYQSARTSSEGFFTGGQLVTHYNNFVPDVPDYYSHDFLAVSVGDPTPVSVNSRQASIRSYSVYLQDSWKLTSGLTVNVGLRWDGQDTDNYLGQKVLRLYDGWQPRIGVVWDPWNDGATKVYGFVGRFDYALPTALVLNSFNDVTRLVTYNYSLTSTAQDPNSPLRMDILTTGPHGDPVDSGLKPAFQDELTFGVERLIGKSLTVALKGTYRRLGAAIEDRCDFDYTSPATDHSSCAIINPGSDGKFSRGQAPVCSGLDSQSPDCTPVGPPTPAASRTYRGIEILARQSVTDQLWFQASYVYSSLRGNYDGGVNQSFYGQTAPGYNSDFDYPELWHDASGTLSLDRTNRFRLDGYWVTPWRLWVGFQAFAETGAPLNQLGYFNQGYGDSIYLVPRGSAGRLPTLWEGNLSFGYPLALGPVTVTLQAYLFNVFNNQIATSRDEEWSFGKPDGYAGSIYDANQTPKNPSYGLVTSRSAPRTFRAAMRVSF